jgi:hypothetical protein
MIPKITKLMYVNTDRQYKRRTSTMASEYSKILVLDSAFADPDGTGVLEVRLARPLPRVKSIELLEVVAPKVDSDRFLCLGCQVNGWQNINTAVLACTDITREPNVALWAVIPSNHVHPSMRTSDMAVNALTNGLFVIDDLLTINYTRWSEPGFFKARFANAAIGNLDRLKITLYKSPDRSGYIRQFKSRVLSIQLTEGDRVRPQDYFDAPIGDPERYPRAVLVYSRDARTKEDGLGLQVWDPVDEAWVDKDPEDSYGDYVVLPSDNDVVPRNVYMREVQIVDADKEKGMLIVPVTDERMQLDDAKAYPKIKGLLSLLRHDVERRRAHISSAKLHETYTTVVVRVVGEGNVNDLF